MVQETTTEAGTFLGPAAILMMSVAAFVDVSEVLVELIPYVGEILSIIIDIGALLIIGGWMYFRSSIKGSETREVPRPRKTRKEIKKIVKRAGELEKRLAKSAKWLKRLKWLRPLLVVIEMIPIVGSVPCWIIAVYLELKYGGG